MPTLLVLSLLTLVLLGHPSTADATMVKCRGDQGSVVYQDEPCKPGMELRNFDTDPATVSVVPGSPVAVPSPPAAAPRAFGGQVTRRRPEQKISSGKAAERRFIHTGMSEAEVIRRIGKPEVDARAGRKQGKDGKHWSYLPAAGDPDTITTLTIVGGLVANVERKIVR
jgi:Domain of unknown function (DUF4124)